MTEYIDEEHEDWTLPISDRALHVDGALHEPLHRLPLGPFQDHDVPVIIDTLKLQMPQFKESPQSPEGAVSGGSSGSSGGAAQSQTGNDKPPPPPHPGANPPHPPPAAPQNSPGAAGSAAGSPIKQPANAAASPLKPPSQSGDPGTKPAQNPNPGAASAGGAVKPGPVAVPPVAAAKPQAAAGAPVATVVAHVTPKPKPPAPPPPPPSKPLPDLTKATSEMTQRLAFTRSQCDKYKFPHEVDADVYLLAKYNISYCKVPKSGSTYWEQVFSFLSKLPKELAYLKIKSPFQISKYDIRYTSHFNLPRHNWKVESDKSSVMKTKRILFVRHPLERLWSSYIEKFYLIDFWASLGLQIRTKGAEVKCPKSITFREFVEFTLPIFNEYWAPITELCNPCTFDPTYIGHIETIREDTLYILKKCNLQWIFTEQEKISRQESHMLDMIIYNYQIHSIQWYSFFHRCLSQKELATRLWDVFKKVGYLSSHAALPDNLPDYNQTTITRELKAQVAKYPLNAKSGKAQQLKIMSRDYQTLPKPIMAKLLEKYAMDFELFGYSTQIDTS